MSGPLLMGVMPDELMSSNQEERESIGKGVADIVRLKYPE